jgi:ParB-like chromosome segregation protein Spo0J
MVIEKVKISEIKLNPNNPRLIKDDNFKKLCQSIKDFPQMLEIRPIVVNNDMIVLGGNMRLKACKEVGLKEVPIIRAENLTEEQQREFLIKDNVSGGEWDWDILETEWNGENLEKWGLDLEFEEEKPDKENNLTPSIELPTITVEYSSDGEKDKLLKILRQFGFNYKIN